jgi:hypothetical protein
LGLKDDLIGIEWDSGLSEIFTDVEIHKQEEGVSQNGQ